MNTNLSTLSDQKLYYLCKFYGEQTKKWRYKFIGLLPEVYKRHIYKKKGFQSIFEFAKKFACLSEEQVRTALNLYRNFEDKPLLKKMLVNGEVSINKLVRITSVAAKENEEFWANQVKVLPSRALETLVKDERVHQKELSHRNGLQKAFFKPSELHMQLTLSDEVKQKLSELQQRGIDINQLILGMLQQRELEIAQEKEQISSQQIETKSRNIPVKIKKLIQQEHGTKCTIKTCSKPAEQIHHTQRFALSHRHDPHYLAPLCSQHHIIAHSIDQKYQRKRILAG